MSFKLEKPQADFTIVCNAVLRDARLTLRAKGLYALMFSKPEGWIFHEVALVKESKEGRDAVRGALGELIKHRWMTKSQPRDGGKFDHATYQLHITVDWKSGDGKTVDGESATTNTDIRKTDKAKRERAQSLEAFLERENLVNSCPSSWELWAKENMRWDAARLKTVWDTFRDYWRAQPGSKALKADWEATWRNWCRRETVTFAKPLAKGEVRVRETSPAEDAEAKARKEFLRLNKLPENIRKTPEEIWALVNESLSKSDKGSLETIS